MRRQNGAGDVPAPRLAVLGSVNLDLVARTPRLPRPGETVTGAALTRVPGGKGANQALAARRLGTDVALFAAVGADAEAGEALALLRAEGVDLSRCRVDPERPTGIALVIVDACGENQIVVAPGANAAFAPDALDFAEWDAVICQLEAPIQTVAAAACAAPAFFCLNAAPVKPVPDDILRACDLLVVNELEAAAFADRLALVSGLVAVTFGARGAELRRGGRLVASASPPAVRAVDTTGAGDVFTAALTSALVSGQPEPEALTFACAAGALATTEVGAQTSFPRRETVIGKMAKPARPTRDPS